MQVTGDAGLIPGLGISKGQMLQHESVNKFNQEQFCRENVWNNIQMHWSESAVAGTCSCPPWSGGLSQGFQSGLIQQFWNRVWKQVSKTIRDDSSHTDTWEWVMWGSVSLTKHPQHTHMYTHHLTTFGENNYTPANRIKPFSNSGFQKDTIGQGKFSSEKVKMFSLTIPVSFPLTSVLHFSDC